MAYSQSSEEEVILNYFGDRVGTLLSMGENNGIQFSNALALIERGWNATLVECEPGVFSELKKLHEGNGNVCCLPYAIGPKNGVMPFYKSGSLLGTGDKSLVSTLVPEEKKRWDSVKMDWEEIMVEVLDWPTLQFRSPFKRYQFVSADVEGADLDAISQMDFNAMGTELICVEWNSKAQAAYDNIILPFGFHLIHTNAENLIYGK